MKKPVTNGALRSWARGISFTIAMGRRQVYTLVSLHLSAEKPYGTMFVGNRHRHMRDFVGSANCLVNRGLVAAHIWKNDKLRRALSSSSGPVYRDAWQLTRAGELVVELLKEAGVYDEVRDELEFADRLQLRIA